MDSSSSTNRALHVGFPEPSIPPNPKLKRYLLIFFFLRLGLYLVLPQFGTIERALLVIRHLKPFFLVLSLGTQVLGCGGSGYLLKKPSFTPMNHFYKKRDIVGALSGESSRHR